MRPSEEELEKNLGFVENLIDLMPDGGDRPWKGRRTMVRRMFEGPVGLAYFTAPASSHEEYHSAYPGGLAQHSLNVVRALRKLSGALCPDRYPDHQLAFVGLFHDLGKVGDGERESYVPNEDQWQRNRGRLFSINPKCVWMPSSERGLYILQKHNIEVNTEEYLAIRLNDGQFVKENEPYRNKEPELALLVHWADMWATRQEKL